MKPVQIIQNGDFSDGLTGWTTNNATATIDNGVVTITKGSGSAGGRLSATREAIVKAHSYYFKCVCRWGTTYARYGFFTSSGSTVTGSSKSISSTSWTVADHIASPSGTANLIALFAGTTSSSSGTYAEFKSLCCIDLTATFGEGNEPDIDTCREIFTEDYYEYNLSNIIYGLTAHDLLLQRRQMLQEIYLPENYIMDGLVLWMDGIKKGSTTQWIDRIAGKVFIGTATFNDNNVEFNGTSNYLYNYNDYTPPGSNTGTIEIVFETYDDTAAQMIFMPRSGSTRLACYFNPTSNKFWIAGGSTTKRNTYISSVIANTKISASFSNARAYLNGTALTASTTDYIGGAVTNYNYIGKRRTDSDTSAHNFFNGKIYSIRIYNRQITADEIAHNYQVDRKRFRF